MTRSTRRARFIICCSCLFFRGRKFTVGRGTLNSDKLCQLEDNLESQF